MFILNEVRDDIIDILKHHHVKKNVKNKMIFNKVISDYLKVKDDNSVNNRIPHKKTRNKDLKDTSIYYPQTNISQQVPLSSKTYTSDSTLLKSTTDALNHDSVGSNLSNKKNSVLIKTKNISLKKKVLKFNLTNLNIPDNPQLVKTEFDTKHLYHSQSNQQDSPSYFLDNNSNLVLKKILKNGGDKDLFNNNFSSGKNLLEPVKELKKAFTSDNMYIHLPSYNLHKDIDLGDFDKDLINDIKKESKKIGDLLLNISNDEYEEIEPTDLKSNSNLVYNIVNDNNLKRIIKVRKITKKPDYGYMVDLLSEKEKFKLLGIDNEFMIHKTLRNLGPPSYIKNKFRVKTTDKFRAYNAKYFGCYV